MDQSNQSVGQQLPSNKGSKKKMGLISVLIIIIVGGLIAGVYFYQQNRLNDIQSRLDQANNQIENLQRKELDTVEEKPLKEKELEKGTFGEKGDYGTFQAEGYLTTVKRSEAFCEDNCEEFDYALFNITRIENTDFTDFLKKQSGNSFVGENSIGLGCLVNGQITYSNNSDKYGSKEYKISKEITSDFVNSSIDKPIVVDFERQQFSAGSGAPTCYSHMTTFNPVI